MSNITNIDDWSFETTQVRARNTLGMYGKPYTGIYNITFTNGQAHVEGLLSKKKITNKDITTLEKYLTSKGYDRYHTIRNGKPQEVLI